MWFSFATIKNKVFLSEGTHSIYLQFRYEDDRNQYVWGAPGQSLRSGSLRGFLRNVETACSGHTLWTPASEAVAPLFVDGARQSLGASRDTFSKV